MSDDAHANAAEAAVAREARLSRIEDDLKKLKPKGKDGWEKLQAMTPLIAGALVAFISYLLTGSVNNAIQREQLQLSNVKEMRELIAQLDKAEYPGQADTAAFTLAAFGGPAVPALMAALIAGGEIRAPAAERSLRTIGMLNDAEAVCGPALRLLDSRTGTFSWLTHLSVIRLMGDLDCRDARTSLEAYSRALSQAVSPADVDQFATRFDSDPRLDLSGVEQLKSEITRTLRIIRQ